MTDPTPHLLVVDDSELNRELLVAILEDEGFSVATATDGPGALEEVERRPPRAILLDVMMPGIDGYEVCRRLKSSRLTCFIPVVLVTALSSTLSKVRGLEAGADDFLNKPIDRLELLARLRSLLRIRELRDELDSVAELIFTMVEALEAKLPTARGHSCRVATLSRRVGEHLLLTPRELYDLVLGALLHDIGKLGVPERVLLRDDADRSEEDRMRYRAHTVQGDRILGALEFLRDARRIVREHHERLDGSGFPDGLQGPAFSLPVEIVAAADLFDRLRGEGPEAAAQALRAEATRGRFHPDVVEEVLRHGLDLAPAPDSLLDLLPLPPPATGGTVLLVDPDSERRKVLAGILAGAGFRPQGVSHRYAARDVLTHRAVDVLLVDASLVGLEEILSDLGNHTRPPVLLMGGDEVSARLIDSEAGIDEILRPPIDRQELVARVRSLLRLRSYRADLVATEEAVFALSSALEARDPFTQGHSVRVATLSERLGRELGLPADDCSVLRTAGLVHDIGKVVVPEVMLLASHPYTDEERRAVAEHVETGYELCRRLRSLHPVLPIVRHHLERFDGSGHPRGLQGEQIPVGARILGLADAFDALTSARSYRYEHSRDESAFLLIKERNEGRWDPEIFHAFGRLMQQGGADDLYETLR